MAEVERKLPEFDDVEGQVAACVGALSSALLTACEVPLGVLQPHVRALSEQMVAYGWRQTDLLDEDAVRAPAWVTAGVVDETQPVPVEPDLHDPDPEELARVDVAPKIPARIPRSALAG